MSKKLHLTAIAVASALISSHSFAAGFQVNETSATGLGRAFAGDAVIADNASVLARNPAAMTRFDRMTVSGGLSYINPSVDIDSEQNQLGVAADSDDDVAPDAFVPTAYFIQPINDQLAWGLALFSNYGFATDYSSDFAHGSDAGKTDLLTININPNIAFKINDNFSVGAGISLVYADAELNRNVGSLNQPGFPFAGLPSSTNLLNLKGDTWEWGWNIGAMYEMDNNNRFALSYRSQVDLDFEGDFSDYLGTRTGVQGNVVKGKLTVVTPAILEFGGFHQVNRQWAVHYGVQWIEWSEFKNLTATSDECTGGVCFSKEEDFDDNFRYSIGATYLLDAQWTLRAGFAFDEQAGAATLSIPDTDRYWYSAGFTYKQDNHLTYDFGFTYLYGSDSTFTEETTPEKFASTGTTTTFSASNTALLFAAQVNYTF